MTWKEGLIGVPLAVFGALLLLITGSALFLTHTSWGREKIRSYGLEKLDAAIEGRVEADKVLEGDLLSSMRLAGVRVYGGDGERFGTADTVEVHYRWSDFLFGDITIPEVILIGVQMDLVQSREGEWNFLQAFKSPDPAPDTTPPGRGRRVVLRDVTIRSGDVTVSTPWDGNPADTRWHILERNGEWRRVLHFERLNATLPRVRVSGAPGMLFQSTQFSSRATIIGDPFVIEQLRADIEVRSDTVSFDVWEIDLAESRLFGQGWVTAKGDPDYDVTLHGSPVETSDLSWLLPQLPPGSARLDFRFRSVPDGVALAAENVRWTSDQAELSGRFAMTTGGSPAELRFEDVVLDIERFRLALIDSLTGWTPPLTGMVAGQLGLDGPLSSLSVDSDLRIDPEGEGGTSRVIALGTVDARPEGLAATDLELRFDSLQIDLVRRFVPKLELRGAITGRVHGNGPLREGLDLEFELQHHDGQLRSTRLGGNGRLAVPERSPVRVDMQLRAQPLSFTTLAEYYPVPLRGDFNGTIRAVGAFDDLDVEAHLAGPGDSIRVQANLQLAAQTPRYQGEIRGWRIRLVEFQQDLPESDLDFLLQFRAQGTELAGLTGAGSVHVFPSFVGGVGIDSATASLRLADGRLLVDTAVVAAEFGELTASGGLVLSGQASDSLSFQAGIDSLAILSPWIFPSTEPGAADLIADGEGPAEEGSESAPLTGSAEAAGWLTRDSTGLVLRGGVSARGFRFRDLSADSVRVREVSVGREDGALRISGELDAMGAGVGGLRFPGVSLSGVLVDTLLDLELEVEKEGASASGSVWVALGEESRTVGLQSLTLRLGDSTWELADSARVRIEDSGALAVQRVILRSDSREVTADGSIGVSGPASFNIGAMGLQLADVARLWPDSVPIAGTLQLNLELSGPVRSPVVKGSFEVADGALFGVSFNSLRGDLSFAETQVTINGSMSREQEQLFSVTGTLPLTLELPAFAIDVPDREIDLRVDGDSIPLSLANLVLGDAITQVTGYAQGSVHVGGTAGDLYLEGPASLLNGGLRVVSTGIEYRDLSGNLRFEGAETIVDTLTFRGVAGGRGRIHGTIDFSKIANPVFDIELQAFSLPAYDQLDARVVVSGRMQVRGPYDAAEVTGKLSIVNGVFYIEEIGRRTEIIDPFEESLLLGDTILALDEGLEGGGSTFLDNATVDLSVSVERETWLRSDQANIEISGDLQVRMHRAQNQLRIDGTLSTVRGDYRYFRRFEVVGGTIEFVGTPDVNPNLHIVTVYTVRTQKEPIRIRLILGGTLEDPTLSLESDAQPPISESDLLSYVIFGRPTYEVTRASEEGSVLSDVTLDLVGGVPRAAFGYALESLLGETGVAYVDVSQAPQTTVGENYQSGVLTATQVEVGWYLAPTVFVSVAQHIADSFQPTVRLEWKMNDNLTLHGVSEPRFAPQNPLFREVSGVDQDQSFGVFLFYGWTY
jgi:translocation and assembly module TamB